MNSCSCGFPSPLFRFELVFLLCGLCSSCLSFCLPWSHPCPWFLSEPYVALCWLGWWYCLAFLQCGWSKHVKVKRAKLKHKRFGCFLDKRNSWDPRVSAWSCRRCSSHRLKKARLKCRLRKWKKCCYFRKCKFGSRPVQSCSEATSDCKAGFVAEIHVY